MTVRSALRAPARLRRVPASLLVGVLLTVAVGACSTGDDEGAATTTTAATSASTTEGPPSSTTSPPAYEGDPGSPFCTLLRDVDPASILAGDAGDPASVGAAFARLVDVLADATEAAPPEIVEDVALVASGVVALDEALAGAGYDFDVLAASGDAGAVTDAMNDPAFTDAGARLGAYRSQVCGL